MFWIEFKKPFFFIVFGAFLGFTSCTSSEKQDVADDVNSEKLTGEEWIKRKIENELNIPATEKYDIEIVYKHINPDTLIDAVILVNRKDYALKHVKANQTERFFDKTGQTGPYNYVYLKLGGVDDVIPTTPVGSNINYPLSVHFLELTSKAYTDFYVEYRVKNSLYRNYYTLREGRLHLTFTCPIYDNIGEENPIVYDVRHFDSPVRMAKDIALFHASLIDYDAAAIEDVNHYQPKGIQATEDLYVYFIFDEKTLKYKTPMRAPEVEE